TNALAKKVDDFKDRTLKLAVQGFGNVGSAAAEEAYHCNHINNQVIAVSDRNVMLYNKDGLNIPELVQFAENNHGELPSTDEQLKEAGVNAAIKDRDDLLTLDVDVLFLAALEDQIHAGNMDHIKARMVVEGANGPVTNEADHYLNEQG